MPPVRTTNKSRWLATHLLACTALPIQPPAVVPHGLAGALPRATRWSIEIPARPASPPVFASGLIVVALHSGVVAAYRAIDAGQAWHVELRADQPLAIGGGRVFVAAADAIHALNAADGVVAWRAQSGTLTAPLLVHQGWIIAASEGQLTAFRAVDGTQVWRQPGEAQRTRASIEGNTLYVPLDDGRLRSLELATGRMRWEHRFRGAPSEVLAFSDRVYVASADKKLHCLDADDGELEWRFPIGTQTRGRPAGDGARVYVTGMDNMVRAFDRADGAMLWHPSVPFRPTTGPVIVGDSVLIAGNGTELRAFESATGRPSGTITLDLPFATPPAFADVDGMTLMAALTGGLAEQWKLSLLEPAPTTIPIEPLKDLPGTIVPIGQVPTKTPPVQQRALALRRPAAQLLHEWPRASEPRTKAG